MTTATLERSTVRSAAARLHSRSVHPSYLGVAAIDELLPSGVSHDTQIMVNGETGVGKTVLAAQFLYEGLAVGDRCIYVACDEPPDAMRANMADLRLGTIAYERAGLFTILDAYARERSTERIAVLRPEDLDEYFAYERQLVESFGDEPVRLCVDSLSTLFGTADPASIVEFSRARLRYLRARRVLALDAYVTGLLPERALAGLSHFYPLIVKMRFHGEGGLMRRSLQLGKLRSGMFLGEERGFRIDARTGIVGQR